MRIKIYIDGACEPYNPGGNMGIGISIREETEIIKEHSQTFPAHADNSNNVAEYLALEWALSFLTLENTKNTKIIFYSDSALLVNQMNGEWKIKQGRYKETALICKDLFNELTNDENCNRIYFQWIPREQNEHADYLSKKSLI